MVPEQACGLQPQGWSALSHRFQARSVDVRSSLIGSTSRIFHWLNIAEDYIDLRGERPEQVRLANGSRSVSAAELACGSLVGFNGGNGMVTLLLAWFWRVIRCWCRLSLGGADMAANLFGWQPFRLAAWLISDAAWLAEDGGCGPPEPLVASPPGSFDAAALRCSSGPGFVSIVRADPHVFAQRSPASQDADSRNRPPGVRLGCCGPTEGCAVHPHGGSRCVFPERPPPPRSRRQDRWELPGWTMQLSQWFRS